ncbi:ABC transporter substrate-binding protein [Pseudoroseicyclus aestuarii]|uniref:Peptide/nickel transport system substrate-binding protein n=1 Tax=Pseudoroseicyclus aestuarii TaxID=1795041 RepID=A0A318SNF3_9RHOB|nr:ABC transporter substrate-binding protein [Pseudoroseicyclus aestuarii]PYE82364.1 peptide/nickel transport system substrate-binding protein [Pseudoroseicyclus aestuarii]
MMHRSGLKAAAIAALMGATAMPALADTPPNMLIVASAIDDLITLDPAEAFEFSAGDVVDNVYEKLVSFDPTDLEAGYQPSLAESWEVSEDGTEITFTLAEDHVFASGNPVTANDAAYSLQRAVKLDKTPSFILTQFGFTADNVEERITAPDETTLVLTLDQPYAVSFVLNCLTATIASVVDSETVMANAGDDMGNTWLRNNSAGSGPYMLQSWTPDESYILQANENYSGEAPALPRIVVQHIPESATQRLQLERGDIDVARDLSPSDIAGIEGSEDIKVMDELRGRIQYWGANQKSDVLSNPQVIEAMKWATDYQGMADSFLSGQYNVHQAFLPETFLGAMTDTPYSFDIEKAQALMDESGVEDAAISMEVRDDQIDLGIAQSLQNTWGQIGIEVELNVGTGAQTLDVYRSRQHDIYLGAWGPDYPDPNTNAGTFAYNPDNSDEAQLTGLLAWRNAWAVPEAMNEATQAAVTEQDTEARAEQYMALQEEFAQTAPFGIMFQQVEQNAMRSEVEGWVAGGSITSVFYWAVSK